ncbi:MAG: tetratricopeptide repeat protein [Alphaproteobacteria bacterium]|nr:tetratricopeptide repeat protein [Alphaproteobacteria bacterium]
MKVTCRSCGTVREIAPPTWVVASGKPFQMTCAACGRPQDVHPTGIVVLDAGGDHEDHQVLEMPAPSTDAGVHDALEMPPPSTDAGVADELAMPTSSRVVRPAAPAPLPARHGRRSGGRPPVVTAAVPFDSDNREAPSDPDPEDEPTEPSFAVSAEAIREAALAWDAEQAPRGPELPVEAGPPAAPSLAPGAYAVLIDGDVYEAPDRTELFRWIDDQRVHGDDLVVVAGGTWMRARELPEVAARLAALTASQPLRMPVVVGAPPGGNDPPRPLPRAHAPTGTLTHDGTQPPSWAAEAAPGVRGLGASELAAGGPQGPASHVDDLTPPRMVTGRASVEEDEGTGRLGMVVLALALIAVLVAAWQTMVGFEVPSRGGQVAELPAPARVIAPPVDPAAVDALVAPPAKEAADEVAVEPAPEPPAPKVETPAPAPAPVPVTPKPAPVAPRAAAPARTVVAPTPAPAPAPARVAPPEAPRRRAALSYTGLIEMGWAAVERNDLVQALGAFGDALDMEPRGAEAQYGLGYALVKRGRLTEGRLQLCRARVGVTAMDRREIDGVLKFHGLSCE